MRITLDRREALVVYMCLWYGSHPDVRMLPGWVRAAYSGVDKSISLHGVSFHTRSRRVREAVEQDLHLL
jgi:hypothetical protein